ncbi:hypothetical protein AB6A40_003150 [Gnathostoma spinigerum]|uniref:Biotin carboxylation domain-containing protein n=1 Tax=Gnathostoma spinigerum TaxID=75299 RepID=A0ABD6EB71_9BILA
MLNKRILLSTNRLKRLSPFVHRRKFSQVVEKDFKKVLVANRGEPAVRIFRALNEMGKASVAIYSELDKISSHRTKADESYMISKGMDPVEAYMNIEEIIEVAKAVRLIYFSGKFHSKEDLETETK